MCTLGIAQQSVLTTNIRDCVCDVTEHQGFFSGNEGIHNVVLAACCERLLPKYVDLTCSVLSRTKVIKNMQGLPVLNM